MQTGKRAGAEKRRRVRTGIYRIYPKESAFCIGFSSLTNWLILSNNCEFLIGIFHIATKVVYTFKNEN
jgi:hypothetical protein